MSNSKPEETLDKPSGSRSLGGFALGATEYFFLLGLILLAAGVWLVFGVGWCLVVVGVLLIAVAFYNAQVG